MSVHQDPNRIVFQKLSRQLTKLKDKPLAENVHKFRTSGRRVETLLAELVEKPSGNQKKLLKLLAHLRKKAGRVRDLDVQILSLRNLRMPEEPGRKTQLMRVLAEQRVQREEKLIRAFDRDTVRELRKRLKRVAVAIDIPKSDELMTLAMRRFGRAGRENEPLTEEGLHGYRIAGKRARYLAELAGYDPEAKRAVEQLKAMQDAIGDWHDWWKLTQQAEKIFAGVRSSALLATLRNVTRHKFRQAVDALTEAKAVLGKKAILLPSTLGRRQPEREDNNRITAAAS